MLHNQDVKNNMLRGMQLLNGGDLDAASYLFKLVLATNKRHADANHLLGIIESYKGNKKDAVRLIKKAIKLKPDAGVYHRNLGLIYSDIAKYDAAIVEFKKAIYRDKNDAQSHSDLGMIYSKKKRTSDAVREYKIALKKDPHNFIALNNLGNELLEDGRIDDAIDCFIKSTSINENFFDSHYNLGNAYSQLGMLHNAVMEYKKALKINPKSKRSYHNLGVALAESGLFEDAIESYRNAINIDPESKDSYNNLGNLFKDIGQLNQAIICYKHALVIDPEYVLANLNIGHTKRKQGSLDEAVTYYVKALDVDPTQPDIHLGLGNAYMESGNIEDAIYSYRNEVKINLSLLSISRLIESLRTACEWNDIVHLMEEANKLKSIGSHDKQSASPFILLSMEPDPAVLLDDTMRWCKQNLDRYFLSTPFSFVDRPVNNRIRIGYISGDFRQHPIGILTSNMFKYHSREKFEIYIYSYGEDDGSSYRKSTVSGCDVFRDIRDVDFLSAARKIFNDKIDILVDLTGFTHGGRHQICAYKAAPIQVNYLGFPGSSGARFFDYIITDWVLSPSDDYERHFSEKLVRLPDCYQVNSQSIDAANNGYTRSEFSLPEDKIVFCSFNNPRKIDATVFRSWMKILGSVDGSVLWMHEKNKLQVKNLKMEAESAGIDSSRLLFVDTMSVADHLERHALADIALDTFIYSGGITTSLSLAANVPVVTLQGDRYTTRMTSSLLKAVSLSNLVANTIDEYEKIAIELANNKKMLSDVKNRLVLSVNEGPLFDTKRFIDNLEKAYTEMYHVYSSGSDADNISLRRL